MCAYFNPGNGSFASDSRGRIYVDKTGLLEILNDMLGTPDKCIALSHARRFGKSQAAGMIGAYYSCGADSRELFSRFEIAKAPDFETHLNKYNVIHLDISSVADFHKEDLVDAILDRLRRETHLSWPGINIEQSLNLMLEDVFELTGRPFVIIIDEWDCVIRNHADRPDLVHRYLQFLHSLFKSEESKTFLALAWITGILPVKKIHDESALNNFREYTMVDSHELTPYFGFTEDEVRKLCARNDMEFDSMRQWYNGYLISGMHMANPNSVCLALSWKKCGPYWKNTSSFDTINTFVTLNFDGLKENVLTMLAGGRVPVDVESFQNDFSQIRSKDEALTALIHLGYLGFDAEEGEAYLPNYEVASAWRSAMKEGAWADVAGSISRCDELLRATISGDSGRVAELVELAHETYSSILKFNDENSLACALSMAYFTAPAYYTVVRKMPAGKGFADLVFLPRREAGMRPAMVVELKWNASADTAIRQIHERRYAGVLAGRGNDVLLVGISYDKDARERRHSCIIETIRNTTSTV